MPAIRTRSTSLKRRYQIETRSGNLLARFIQKRRLPLIAGVAATLLGAASVGVGIAFSPEAPDVDRVASATETASQPVAAAEQTPAASAAPALPTPAPALETATAPVEAPAPAPAAAAPAPAPASPIVVAPASVQLANTSGPAPVGVPGSWTMTFADEFNGVALDSGKWSNCWFSPNCGTMNKVSTSPANVRVADGSLALSLASPTSGALVSTNPKGGAGSGYQFTTGYVEARIKFPGNANGLTNWPAFWTTGQSWPSTGENDIAEVLKAQMTVNYHSSSGTHNQGTVPGSWANQYHTFGLHRMANSSDVYFDGVKVKSYPTDDGNAPQYIVLNIGASSTNPVYGAPSELMVDYVRAWQ